MADLNTVREIATLLGPSGHLTIQRSASGAYVVYARYGNPLIKDHVTTLPALGAALEFVLDLARGRCTNPVHGSEGDAK